jgi:hypothetical protein
MAEVITSLVARFSSYLWLAQTQVVPETSLPAATTPEAASVLFSGPQFFIALLSGILLAFAFQLVFTNLSVAAGISYLGRKGDHDDSRRSDESGLSIRKIGMGVGLWTLITVTLALFLASFLAVQLSLLTSAQLGAIVGLVIWAAYFSLLMWVSSSTVGSLIGSVINTATSGLQAILGTATAAIGGNVAKQQAVSTAEAVAAAVRNELGAGIDPTSIRQSIEDYIRRIQLPSFDYSRIRQDLESLLNDPEVQNLADGDGLKHINRQTFVDLISRRTDFSSEEVSRLADLLEGIWRQTIGQRSRRDQNAELIDYLRSTQPGQVKIDELNAKVDRLLAERSAITTAATEANQNQSSGLQQTLQSGMNTLIGLLVGRTDLSDLDIEQVLQRLKAAPAKVVEQRDKLVGQLQGEPQAEVYSPVKTDVENYLLNTPVWQMTPDRVNQDFRNLLYDQESDPSAVADQLVQLNRSYFIDVLTSRGLLTQDRIHQIANTLESVRQEVVHSVRVDREREIASDLKQRIGIYLTLTPKEQLLYSENGILPAFRALLEDGEADYEVLRLRLAPYHRDALRQMLEQRQDISYDEREIILNLVEATRDRVLQDSQSLNEQAKQRLAHLQSRLEDYLRNTGRSELNPEGIKRDLQLLVADPQLGMSSLRYRASRLNRDTLVKLLSQREDLNEQEVNQIIDQVESNWNSLIHASQVLTVAARNQYDQTLAKISDYLRRTNLEVLNPEGIQQDLNTLLHDPREGTLALRRRLSRIDRETLVRLLSQRQDLSAAQVNQAIDKVQTAIRSMTKAPRRLALRAQQQVMGFEASLGDYLRNTDKEELNPEGIKRDLRLLLESPQAGLQNLSDRLSRMDRSTLVSLLSQRRDMTPEEAERVVAQIESVRDQAIAQMQQIQHRIQEIIDRIFNRIRDYLNALNRPELNYDSLKQDIRTLFDDPQAGFEALRQRLSHFDRGTLVALLSSRQDISEAQANQIVDQFESARTNVLQRAEMIQNEAQRRLESVKQQAQEQMEETRKAAATAAWWLFITAIVSAAASAGAGALASL